MVLFCEETQEELRFSDLYDFKGFLGTGSFGFVVKAQDKQTMETIAIKVSNQLSVIILLSLTDNRNESQVLQELPRGRG